MPKDPRFDLLAHLREGFRLLGTATAIEAGVPEHILWMQSGHAQDVAARRYVQPGAPVPDL